jgi:hypothetical protein
MATHVTVIYGETILIDYNKEINWVDKGTSFPALPNTVHAVIWNDLTGQNEVQFKDASTGNMTGNTNLNAKSDTIHGSITVQNLLDYCDTRISQINQAHADFLTASQAAKTSFVNDGNNEDDFKETTSGISAYWDFSKTWIDYDSNYS